MRTDDILSSRPARSFLELSPHVRVKDRPPQFSPPLAIPHRPPLSSAVYSFLPLFSVVFHRPMPSPTVLHQKMSQIVGLVVLPNDGGPENSRTRTDHVLPSRLVPGSWKFPCRALQGPRTAENTGPSSLANSRDWSRYITTKSH